MKKINILFETDEDSDQINITIRASKMDSQVSQIIESLKNTTPEKFTVLDADKCPCVINVSDIFFISAEGKFMRIITEAGIFTAKQTLQTFEQLLGKYFLRISRFEIINLRKVHKYDFTIVGTLRIEFENGMETWASRRYIPLIKERLLGEEEYLC